MKAHMHDVPKIVKVKGVELFCSTILGLIDWIVTGDTIKKTPKTIDNAWSLTYFILGFSQIHLQNANSRLNLQQIQILLLLKQ